MFRHLVDLAQPDSSRGVIVPGNSGDPASVHATDLLARWRDHEDVPFYLDWGRIAANQESDQVLAPGH